MDKLLQKIYADNYFISIISDMIENNTVKQMNDFKQHYETTCFEHCLVASYYCYLLCKKFKEDLLCVIK